MENRTLLGPADIIADRPFTHPDHIFADRLVLRYLIDQLCLIWEKQQPGAPSTQPLILRQQEPDGRQYRTIITGLQRLLPPNALTVVGFFGHKSNNGRLSAMEEVDAGLVAELPSHPDLLNYSTLELTNGDFGNLVLFANPQAKDHWGSSKMHARAVKNLAPIHYESVRIYNGTLHGGIVASNTLRLTCVKYYDYQEEPVWQAVRMVGE